MIFHRSGTLHAGSFQEFTDNAVSKTVNSPMTPPVSRLKRSTVSHISWDVRGDCLSAIRKGSLTVGSKQTTEEKQSTQAKHRPRKRPAITRGQTERVKTGCGTLYVTVNEDDEGVCEVFTTIGKAGGCAAAFSEATARLISLALRSGVELEEVVRQLKGIRCPHPVWQNGRLILSCPDAIAMVLQRYLDEKKGITDTEHTDSLADKSSGTCPECGGQLMPGSGCETCVECGFSRCG